MSDEEICAISDEYADSFASAESAYNYYSSRLGTFQTKPSPNDSPKTGDKGVHTAISLGILALASVISAKKRK